MRSQRPDFFTSFISIFLGIFLSITTAHRVWAAPGDLDATFGSTEGGLLGDPGIALVDFGSDGDGFGAVLPLSDGKFIVVGDTNGLTEAGLNGTIGVGRVTANGLLDNTFSGDGRIVQRYPDPETSNPQSLSWLDAALQADGKIVLVGTTSTTITTPEFTNLSRGRVGLTRLNADGSIDTSFGTNGGVKLGFGADIDQSRAAAVVIQGDGKIVIVGQVEYGIDGLNRNFAIARYNSNGTLDTSFDGDGTVVTDFGANQHDAPSDLRIQSDGKIVVVGYATLAAGGDRQFAVARYNSNGSLDTTFSGDGKTTTTLNTRGVANDAVIQADGKIVAVGAESRTVIINGVTYENSDFVVVRYNSNGSLDTTFGIGGITVTDFYPDDAFNQYNFANAVALQSDGKILVGGSLLDVTQYDFLLARYTANGTLDSTFDTSYGDANGQVRTSIFPRLGQIQSGALDMVVQADGKVVVGGSTNTGVPVRGHDAVLLRYLTAESPPVITSTPVTTAVVGQPYQYQATANDPGVTWSLVSGPGGMAIGATSGLVTWTPGTSGSFGVEIRATNGVGAANQAYTVVVSDSTNTGLKSPGANAANTGGDNNGFQTTAANAHADDGLFAVDTDSGSSTSTSCTNTGKDKHRYYNYGLVIPSGKTIKGIEVRLDAKADSTSGSPKMCVQLSWDGGASWTTTKTTATLTTGEATYTLGSATDKWGRASWSAANVSDTSFRVRIINIASNTARDFSLDWVAVRVHY